MEVSEVENVAQVGARFRAVLAATVSTSSSRPVNVARAVGGEGSVCHVGGFSLLTGVGTFIIERSRPNASH